jgi:hypothetical protein
MTQNRTSIQRGEQARVLEKLPQGVCDAALRAKEVAKGLAVCSWQLAETSNQGVAVRWNGERPLFCSQLHERVERIEANPQIPLLVPAGKELPVPEARKQGRARFELIAAACERTCAAPRVAKRFAYDDISA